GETSGALHIILERLARETEQSNQLWMKVKNALTYPVMVLVAAMVLVVWAQNVVFKDLLQFLSQLGVSLPWTTRVLMVSSRILSSPFAWVVVGAAGIGCLWGLRLLLQRPALRLRVWTLILLIPGLGQALRTAAAVDFSRSLAMCQAAGIPILRGIELAAMSVSDPVLHSKVGTVKLRVAEGCLLHEALRDTQFFPGMVIHMLAAGEATGKISIMLEKCAKICEESMEQALDMATAALQPLVLLLVGVLVGFVVLATMSPMLKVVETL
ncbi:MAG: type II secretion system F family protein, partial [Candidatus Eremiobacterota bacterium]